MPWSVRHLRLVPSISLTGADFFDLAAGFSFNTIDETGDEIDLFGDEFSEADIAALARSESVLHHQGGEEYTLTAPEEPWHGHHDDEEMAAAWNGPFAPRLPLLGLVDPDAAPAIERPGVRSRLSPLAERRAGRRLVSA